MVEKLLSAAKGKLVNHVGGEGVADILIAVGSLTDAAGNVLRVVGLSTGVVPDVCAVVSRVGPKIGGVKYQAPRVRPGEGRDQPMEVAVVVRRLIVHQTKVGQRSQTGNRIENIDHRVIGQMRSMAADIAEVADDPERKHLLDGHVPLIHLFTHAIAVEPAWRVGRECGRGKHGRKRKAGRSELCGRVGKPLAEVAQRRYQITQLRLSRVQAVAKTKHRLVTQERRRPSQGYSGLQVTMIGVVEGKAGLAVPGRTASRVKGQVVPVHAGEIAE